MAHLLYHWRQTRYGEDRESGGLDFSLGQGAKAMENAEEGESVWAFTRRADGVYVLAAHLIVESSEEEDDPGDPGKIWYWIYGDQDESRYFDVDSGPNAEPLIRSLSVRARGRTLGSSFQGHAGVRVIDESDQQRLFQFAANLPLLDESEIIRAEAAEQPEDEEDDIEGEGRSEQGRQEDPLTRRAVEQHAMQTAITRYEQQGYRVADTSARKPYDLECHRRREVVRVEVKGTTGPGESILLTDGEVRNAQDSEAAWRTDLFIVHGIEVAVFQGGERIPAGGTVRVIEDWTPEQADLAPVEWRYRVPAKRRGIRDRMAEFFARRRGAWRH